MAKYGVHFRAFATAAAAKTALSLQADGAGEEAEIVELALTGSGTAAAADRQHEARLAYCTFGGAGTPGATPTPEKFHQKAAAATIAAKTNYTAEPTVVASVFLICMGFNQRGGVTWSVPLGEGIKIRNADASPGIVWQVLSDAVGEVGGHGHWHEP